MEQTRSRRTGEEVLGFRGLANLSSIRPETQTAVYPDDRWRSIAECLAFLVERGEPDPDYALATYLEAEASAPLVLSRAARLYELVEGVVTKEFRHSLIPPYVWRFRGSVGVIRGPNSFATGDLVSSPDSYVTFKAEEILIDFQALERVAGVNRSDMPEQFSAPRGQEKRAPFWRDVALAALDLGLSGKLHTRSLTKHGGKSAIIDDILQSPRMPHPKPSRASIRKLLEDAGQDTPSD